MLGGKESFWYGKEKEKKEGSRPRIEKKCRRKELRQEEVLRVKTIWAIS